MIIMHILHNWQTVSRKFPEASNEIYIVLSVHHTDNIVSVKSLAQNRRQAIILDSDNKFTVLCVKLPCH